MSDCLPIELVAAKILLHLPIPTLLRCRSVCKQWRSLIDSPEFIKTHSSAAAQNDVLFLLRRHDEGLYAIPHPEDRQTSLILPPRYRYYIPPESVTRVNGITLFGSCNGLLCLHYRSTNQVHIINPATRRHNLTRAFLPEGFMTRYTSAGYSAGELDVGYGFGYDSVSDDYKVVRICHLIGSDGTRKESEVISFGIGRKTCQVTRMPYLIATGQKLGVFSGGALYWIVGRHTDLARPRPVLVTYDLGANQCREIEQPKYDKEGTDFILNIGVMGNDRLCMFVHHFRKVVHVWTMGKNSSCSVKCSWSKMVSFRHPDLYYSRSLLPLGLSSDGDQVLLHLDGEKLVWYDMKKGNDSGGGGKEVNIHGVGFEGGGFDAVVCHGSLVALDGKSPPGYGEIKQMEVAVNEEEDNYDYYDDYRYGCGCSGCDSSGDEGGGLIESYYM